MDGHGPTVGELHVELGVVAKSDESHYGVQKVGGGRQVGCGTGSNRVGDPVLCQLERDHDRDEVRPHVKGHSRVEDHSVNVRTSKRRRSEAPGTATNRSLAIGTISHEEHVTSTNRHVYSPSAGSSGWGERGEARRHQSHERHVTGMDPATAA